MKRLVLTAIAALVFSAAPAASTGENLLCHLSFDDESKPFKAEVGKDAFVRLGKDERVEGLNKTKWTNEGGDGAVTVQKDTSIAIPVPDVLAKEAGRPYSVLLKLKLHDMATHPVFNMPADKMDDTLITSTLYGRLCLRQHERDVMSRGGYGVVPQDKIFTLLLCFGADSTTAFIDEKQILSSAGLVEGKLAGSRADCSKAGGYFLLRGLAGDPLPANITFYDVKIYDGVVDPHDAFSVEKKTPAENAGGAENKNSPSNTTSPSPVATPTANNPTSPAGGKNGQTGGATSTNGGGTSTQGGGSSSQGGGASGDWLCRITFDDSANPLKAEGVADAFVRKGRKGTTERISGMGDIKWTSAGGDGAVEIPKDWHIALPVPDKLAKEPGHPYSIEMRFRFSALDDWQPLLNMPADNETDSLVYVNQGDSRLAIKQHNKASGTAVYGESGFVVGKDHTLVLNFGANKTTAFLDGKQVFSRECTLAGSYADCSKAGGYFLIRGDENGEGGTVTFYEVKVYDGAVGATTPAENAEGAEDKNSPSNTTSPSPVATPAANNPPSPVATPTANNPTSPAGGKNGQTGGATSTNGGGTSTQGGGATTPVGTPESAGKEIPGKNPDTPTGQSTGKSGSSLTTEKPGKTDFPKPETSTDQGDSSQGSGNKGGGGSVAPSAEVQQVLNTFLADNGLSAAEKIPPLKAYIEKLIDLLEKLAKEANDEETLKWVEENRKKLADKKKGGETTASVPFKPVKPLVQLDFEDSILPLRRPKERLFQNNKEVLAIMTMRILLSQGRDRNSDDKFAAIRNDCYVALQIPDELLREPGHPYSVAIKFKLHSRQGCQSFLNMPADNKSDAMVYLNVNGQLAIKQHSKAAGSAVLGGYGFAVGTPQMLLLRFGTDQTTAYLDGKLVFSHNGPLAGSYADCSKAGGYFLIRGDDNKDGDTIDFYDFKVFDGVIDPRNVFGKSWTDDGTGVVMTTESGGKAGNAPM